MGILKQRTPNKSPLVDNSSSTFSSRKDEESLAITGNDDSQKKASKCSAVDYVLNFAIVFLAAIIVLSLTNGNINSSTVQNQIQNVRKALQTKAPSDGKATTPEVPGKIETITAEQLSALLPNKENVVLGKSAAQSSTGNGELKPVASSNTEVGDCGCPLTCDATVLGTKTPGLPYSCGARISYFMNTHGSPRDEACKATSEQNPSPCGADNKCNPEKCPKPEPVAREEKEEILGGAEKALDGDKNQSYDGKSVTATNEEENPWWQVDLGGVYAVENVVLYNRMDCCSERLKNFHVELMDQNAEGAWVVTADVKHDAAAGPITLTTFKEGSKGKIVRVRIEGKQVLSLAEVEVYGTAV